MMAVMENEALKERLKNVLLKLNVPLETKIDPEAILNLIQKDKKVSEDHITLVLVEKLGQAELKEVPLQTLKKYLKGA